MGTGYGAIRTLLVKVDSSSYVGMIAGAILIKAIGEILL